MEAMMVLLVLGAVVGGAVGLVLLSQATLGVGVIAGACLLGILARLAQAAAYHQRLLPRDAAR